MDKTKKYTILVLIVCFLGIGIIGLCQNKEKVQNTEIEKNQIGENTSKMVKTTISITGLNGILTESEIEIEQEKSVYDVLKKLCDQNDIEMKTTGFGPIIYVSGIDGLNEFDHGNQSGWKYKVNGEFVSIGAGSYKVKDGDCIEWVYTTRKD